ncbi:uncharacterized protein LOC135707321 isoform X2 [Ochlerotatus camptorhynchus]
MRYTEEEVAKPFKTWPWHVALYSSDNNYIAGGSIISEWFVLTAAQVTYINGSIPMKPNELQVVMGIRDLSDPQNYKKKSNVSNIIRYENYNPQTRMNDLALLKVDTIIEFNHYISSICLWPSVGLSLEALAGRGQQGIVVGWKWVQKGDVKHVLSETNVSASNVERCADLLQDGSSKKKNYCMTSSGESVHSGGGMYFQLDDVWHVRGIVSQRPPTIEAKDVKLVDITYYQKWIERHALPKQHNLLGLEDCGMGSYVESNDREKNILAGNQHPWIAHLAYLFWGRFNVSDCHGVLIHPEFVVTSAKCTDSRKYRELLHVILGECSVGKDPYSSNRSNIQAVKVEEHLFSQAIQTSEDIFDINVLRLAKNVILTDNVKPVCLPPVEEPVPYYSMTAWYRRDEHPKELKTSLMRLVPFDQCRSSYLEMGINFTTKDYVACFEPCQLSEKAETDGTYNCDSTKIGKCNRALSASPIFFTQHDGVNTYTYLAGVRSFGTADCHDGMHDVFNDIVSFRSWIETLVDEKAWFTDDEDHVLHDYEPVTHTIHYEMDDDGNLIYEDADHKIGDRKLYLETDDDGNRKEIENDEEP